MNFNHKIKKLAKEVKRLEKVLNNPTKTNKRYKVVRIVAKSGLIANKILPYMLSTILSTSITYKLGNYSCFQNTVVEKALIESIYSSDGQTYHKLSDDKQKDSIEYTTGWIKNEYGLYQRTITTYRINKNIDLSNITEVLSMSKEDVEKILEITNIETIYKQVLLPTDELFNEDALIISKYEESDSEEITRPKEGFEYAYQFLLYLFLCISIFGGINVVEKRIIKKSIEEKLHNIIIEYDEINEEKIINIEVLLGIKKDNLQLLTETEANEYPAELRRLRKSEHNG